jgi:hypothetical protein
MNAPFEILEEVTGVSVVFGSSISPQLAKFAQVLVKSYQARYPNSKLLNENKLVVDASSDY